MNNLSRREQIKQFWDLIFSVGAIVGIIVWYYSADYPSSMFDQEHAIGVLFVTLGIIPAAIIAIVFSIIRHRNQIKLFYKTYNQHY